MSCFKFLNYEFILISLFLDNDRTKKRNAAQMIANSLETLKQSHLELVKRIQQQGMANRQNAAPDVQLKLPTETLPELRQMDIG